MNAADILGTTVDLLEAAGVRYMITGSFASSYYGELRATADLDLVVEVDSSDVDRLLSLIDRSRWYVSDNEVRTAQRLRTMANLIDLGSGWKVDLVVRKDRPFSLTEFDRRRDVVLYGRTVVMASAEDVILSKLEWARESGSERQLRDARSITAVQGRSLDWGYLRAQAATLGVTSLLDQILDDPDI